ncbi:hypothetical protein GCK72_012115 [Caenorhabditis remanei]|uniref:SCP domain-containing protein n=1 Tax=Caenorhabditis remanei TaxID=31234 RepID=A0A6A5GMA8_CAERE|nr:hypothetical protein GCK72_012115 [Caenorhabditis remanei]KAF1755665.1 hypothetical protein GCK72_012115 [Caenorhabditis remanei]
MKLPIPIGIPLLLLLAQLVYPAAIVVKRTTDTERNQLVAQVNNMRSQVATKKNISNMHELSYDMDLERQAQTMNCNSPPTGPFMVVSVLSKKWQAEINAAPYAGLFGPQQTRIGCAKLNLDCSVGACLIGPQSNISKNDFTKGEPGSNCPNGKASSGLCRGASGNFRGVRKARQIGWEW